MYAKTFNVLLTAPGPTFFFFLFLLRRKIFSPTPPTLFFTFVKNFSPTPPTLFFTFSKKFFLLSMTPRRRGAAAPRRRGAATRLRSIVSLRPLAPRALNY